MTNLEFLIADDLGSVTNYRQDSKMSNGPCAFNLD